MANEADICTPQDVLNFWFGELTYDDWFGASKHELDQTCLRRFQASHMALARGVGEIWRASPENRLAAIVLLDQMPRNMYRGTPLAFATDCLALNEAKLAIGTGSDMAIKPEWRAFVYLPFEHSENLIDQTLSVKLFTELGDAEYLDYAIRHREVIERFGRFPHRNAFLARHSTEAELAYLATPGAGF